MRFKCAPTVVCVRAQVGATLLTQASQERDAAGALFPLEMPPLSNLSDGQTSELMSLFKFFDTDGDGLISPRSCTKLCERLGFHLETSQFAGDPGSTPLSMLDMLGWVDQYCGQCQKSDELALTQRFALLRHHDVFSTGNKISRDALANFLQEEQHVVTDEALDALLAEMGTNGSLTKPDLAMLVGSKNQKKKIH